ncbi:KUP/HAK/KT family potassium transporter [Kitasatospora sp. DSM 101779]|uniref:KUP/HAK/KT family potassium transporter n=1 Tax=Kitasatospora sp. DSM 101779 TaxID=2853165 RepID=UPI0039882B4F
MCRDVWSAPTTGPSTSPPGSATWRHPTYPARSRCSNRSTPGGELQLDRATYFLSKIELRRGKEPTMAPWRKRLFIATSYITADAAEYVGLPRDRTVIMGSHVEV